jgi:dolichol-phosphate mannosyltransferase
MKPTLSVIVPMFNEAPNVARLLDRVVAQLEPLGRPFEIICIDDGSTDSTAACIDEACRRDPRVQMLSLSRNFGKEAALAAGLDAARGDAVIVLDADLQHPPDLIPAMVAKWDEGFEVVEGVKESDSMALPYRLSAAAFYGLMGAAAGDRLRRSSDFKLLDRQVLDVLAQLPERHRFFRGLVAWVGFRVAKIPFHVSPRSAGVSKWSVLQLTRYAIRNVISFSSTPLRLVAWVGFVTLVLAALLGAQTLWNWWRGVAITGFTTVILTVLALGGLILLSLGVIAVYLAQMYDEQKARPIYVVRRNHERERTLRIREHPADVTTPSASA